MNTATYLALGIGIAVAITFTLRVIPFVVKGALGEHPVVSEVARWMPIGAMVILAAYCVISTDTSGTTRGLPELGGLIVTVALHLWRRAMLLSVMGGTVTCVALYPLVASLLG